MDLISLPPEIIELILLGLDIQDLAACALVDDHLEKIVYSRHFLDEYCRHTFGCSWLTIEDVCNMYIPEPNEFWTWVYNTVKVQDLHHGPFVLPSNYLTKISTLKHLFFIWLISGHRSTYIDSHTLMNILYPIPKNVEDIYVTKSEMPERFIIDTLLKVFMWLPEIIYTTYGSVDVFKMQKGPVTNPTVQHLYQTRLEPKLQKNLVPLYSVEIMCSPNNARLHQRAPVIVILFTKNCWILWFGMPSIIWPTPDALDYIYFGTLNYKVKSSELTGLVQTQLTRFSKCIHGDTDYLNQPSVSLVGSINLCPIIKFGNSDIPYMTVLLAHEKFKTLQKNFQVFLKKIVNDLVQVICQECNGDHNHDRFYKLLSPEPTAGTMYIDEYVCKLFKVDENNYCFKSQQQRKVEVCKCILHHTAYIFRNEIQRTLNNQFSHVFLCKCTGRSFHMNANPKRNEKLKLERCMANKLKGGWYSPEVWAPHILSAASLVIPAIVEVLQSDLNLLDMGRFKYAISTGTIHQLTQRLKLRGLTLKNRPPIKPRYPPIVKQLRLLTSDSLY